jgi:tRNA dimethylallyltransferase
MDLGTGKDYNDYIVNGIKIPYHLIDIHEPGYKYNVYQFQQDFYFVYNKIRERGKTPLMCGGTGMYIESVTKGYKLISVPVNESLRMKLEKKSLMELENQLAGYKKLHNKTDVDTKKRAIRAIEIEEFYLSHPEINHDVPEINPIFLGIHCDREIRRKNISLRLQQRIENGMIEEVKGLLNEGIPPQDLIYYGLEYKYITEYLTGFLQYDEMVTKLNVSIHQFAKRQMTWFRKMEREGIKIHWIDSSLSISQKLSMAKDFLRSK